MWRPGREQELVCLSVIPTQRPFLLKESSAVFLDLGSGSCSYSQSDPRMESALQMETWGVQKHRPSPYPMWRNWSKNLQVLLGLERGVTNAFTRELGQTDMLNKVRQQRALVKPAAVPQPGKVNWLVCTPRLLQDWPWAEAKKAELRQGSSLSHSLGFARLPSKAGALSATTWTP